MRIQWNQLDPCVAHKVRLSLIDSARRGVKPSSESYTVRGKKPQSLEIAWSIFSLFTSALIVALYLNVAFNLTGPAATLFLTLLPITLLLAIFAPTNLPAQEGRPVRIGRWVRPTSHVRDAFTTTAMTRAERLYADMVLLLAEADVPRHTHFGKAILRQCNSLLSSSLRLEVQQRRIRRTLDNGGAIHRAETEHIALVRRLDATDDPLTRKSLRESAELCWERLENLRALPLLLSRIEAHQEAICQSFALMQSALLREQSVPVAADTPDITGIRDTVRNITSQARAFEEAVTEVTQY